MKTTIDIPDPLFRELKSFASRHHLSLKAVVESALRELLASGQSRLQEFRLKKHPFGGQGLQEGLSDSDWETIRGRVYEGRGG